MMSKNPSWLTTGYKVWLHNVPFIITNIDNTKYVEITDSEGIKSKHDLLALHKSGHLVLTDPTLVFSKPEQVIEASPNELQRMHNIAHDLQLLDNAKRGQKLNLIKDIAGKYDVSDRQVEYSDANRPVIPTQTGHPFRLNPATHSGANRPPCKQVKM